MELGGLIIVMLLVIIILLVFFRFVPAVSYTHLRRHLEADR